MIKQSCELDCRVPEMIQFFTWVPCFQGLCHGLHVWSLARELALAFCFLSVTRYIIERATCQYSYPNTIDIEGWHQLGENMTGVWQHINVYFISIEMRLGSREPFADEHLCLWRSLAKSLLLWQEEGSEIVGAKKGGTPMQHKKKVESIQPQWVIVVVLPGSLGFN